MTKLHHTEYKKNYKKYILDCVQLDNEEKELKTDQEKINYIFDINLFINMIFQGINAFR